MFSKIKNQPANERLSFLALAIVYATTGIVVMINTPADLRWLVITLYGLGAIGLMFIYDKWIAPVDHWHLKVYREGNVMYVVMEGVDPFAKKQVVDFARDHGLLLFEVNQKEMNKMLKK